MDPFLICANPRCRFVLDLQEGLNGRVLARNEMFLNECPECGGAWSANCPFCVQRLAIEWRNELPHCLHCSRKLQAAAAQTSK